MTFTFTTIACLVDCFVPREELYLPGVMLSGFELDEQEEFWHDLRRQVDERLDRAILFGETL